MTHIVLIGAGHTHIGVLRAYAVNGAPDARITLVAPHPRLYYSGMLPAHVAGHYSWAELAIEAGGLLAQLGATFISTHVTGFDGTTLTLADGQRLAGDIVSFDIGTAPGALAKDHPERVIPVKPVEALLEGLARFERGLDQADKARRLAVVGGGAGGVELMLSLAYRYGGRADRPALDLVARSGVMGGVPGRVRRALARALDRAGVNVITGRGVVDLDDTGLILDDGTHQPADCVIAATGARAPAWLADTPLALDDDGFIACDWHLRSRSHGHVFAAGDVTALPEPRPKSGVYAVRQISVLADNLARAAAARALVEFKAPRTALALISLGERRALALRGRLSLPPSHVLWRIKDRIDRRFVARHDRPAGDAPETR